MRNWDKKCTINVHVLLPDGTSPLYSCLVLYERCPTLSEVTVLCHIHRTSHISCLTETTLYKGIYSVTMQPVNPCLSRLTTSWLSRTKYCLLVWSWPPIWGILLGNCKTAHFWWKTHKREKEMKAGLDTLVTGQLRMTTGIMKCK